jgi:3-hydroxyisobutyrate dehydrogenase-like beta-hydroxyacid dehydrogenase
MAAISKIGILGLGKMGEPMAKHLRAKGYNVFGYDPVDAACRAAAALGVRVLDSPREVARASELVIVVVGFDHEVETVIYGANGVIEAARPGLIVAIGSTVAPRYTQTLA